MPILRQFVAAVGLPCALLLAAMAPSGAQPAGTQPSAVQSTPQAEQNSSQFYTAQEVIDSGHRFFGATTDGLAKVVERAFEKHGLPNGYVLGEEASGAFIGGLTYGEGQLFTKNAGQHPVFWQGPSVGFDYGGQGSRVMMLVYHLQTTGDVYGRFGGLSGQAYLVAGVGMTVLQGSRVVIVPIRTGIGARLGVNLGYLKMTMRPTWNPF